MANEVQKIWFGSVAAPKVANRGVVTITFDGQTTGNLNFDDSAATIVSALEALSNIGSGDVAVSLIDLGSGTVGWQITFQGALANTNVPQVTLTEVDNIATGDGLAVDFQETTAPVAATPSIYTIDLGGATGGTYTLELTGAGTTAEIDWDADDAAIQSALDGVATIYSVSGGVITQTSEPHYPLVLGTDSTTGGSGVTVTEDQAYAPGVGGEWTVEITDTGNPAEVGQIEFSGSAGTSTASFDDDATAVATSASVATGTTVNGADGPLPSSVTLTCDAPDIGSNPSLDSCESYSADPLGWFCGYEIETTTQGSGGGGGGNRRRRMLLRAA